MGSVVLVADETVAARRDVVYGLFGASQGAGWLFVADCDVLAVGSVVSLQLPVGGPQATVDMLGRVTSLIPPRQIVIALDQPWRGRLRVCLERAGAESTRVSVRAEVDERGVEWLLRRRGWPAHQPADDGDYRIGLLTSKSGPGAVFAVACENLGTGNVGSGGDSAAAPGHRSRGPMDDRRRLRGSGRCSCGHVGLPIRHSRGRGCTESRQARGAGRPPRPARSRPQRCWPPCWSGGARGGRRLHMRPGPEGPAR